MIGVVLLVSFVALMAVGATLIVRQSAQPQATVVVDTQILSTESDGEPGSDGARLEVNQLTGVDKLTGVEIRYRGTVWTVPEGIEKGDHIAIPCPGENPTLTLTIDNPRGPGRETVAWWNVPPCRSTLSDGGENADPVADFVHACEDLSCEFDAYLSVDSDGSIESYAWTLGDGASGTGPTPTHAYGTDGDHTVTLRVEDDDGETGIRTRDVTVSAGTSTGGEGGCHLVLCSLGGGVRT